jgi:hypothetical protein
MRTALITLAAVLVAAAPRPAPAQSRQCLHDQLETSGDRARREKALDLADEINRAERVARRFGTRGEPPYKPLEELFNLPDTPEGFRVQLQTDGTSYTFSIKDTRDPCGYAIFSDQSLDIYEAVPTPRRTGPRLLTQE